MNQNQSIDAAPGNEPGRNHCFAKSRGRRQNARVMPEQRFSGSLLIGPQCAMKSNLQRHAVEAFIAENRLNVERPKHCLNFIQTPSRQSEVLWVILSARNDSWLAVGRQSHGLRAIELGILKCGQTQQSVAQPRHKVFFGDIDLVSENYLKLVRKWSGDGWFLSATRWGCRPRIVILLVRQGHANTNNPSSGFRVAHQSLDSRPACSPH